MSMFNKILISVCIPVFNSEKYLYRCIESIAHQTFLKKEIIIVNDNSFGKDFYGNDLSKIIKKAQKEFKIKIKVIDHKENKGLLESRRTAIYAAKGKYICIVDSDDYMEENALENLFTAAEKFNADIVQGKVNVVCTAENLELYDEKSFTQKVLNENKLKETMKRKSFVANKVFLGELETKRILDGFMIEKNHSGFLWGKLYLRETYLEALNQIPFMKCTMSEDFLQYFFLASKAKKYVGINQVVYNYSVDSGISSNKSIETLDKWEQVCSKASIFTFLLNYFIEENDNFYQQEIIDAVKRECYFQLGNSLKQLNTVVAEEIKVDAYKMLCEYWGEDFVKKVETARRTEAFSVAEGESVRTERE